MLRMKSSGQLLIEILIGLAVVTVALVVSLAVVSHATKVSRVTRQRLEATKFAEKVLENIRRERDKDQESFFIGASCGTCGPFGANQEYTCGLSCSFTPNQVEIRVSIKWEDGESNDNTSNVNLSTILGKYRL